MTELELYKFITDNDIEWHNHNNEGDEDVIMFVEIYNLEKFYKILSPSILDEDGIECTMRDGYFAFWMKYICDYFGIEINKVFIEE